MIDRQGGGCDQADRGGAGAAGSRGGVGPRRAHGDARGHHPVPLGPRVKPKDDNIWCPRTTTSAGWPPHPVVLELGSERGWGPPRPDGEAVAGFGIISGSHERLAILPKEKGPAGAGRQGCWGGRHHRRRRSPEPPLPPSLRAVCDGRHTRSEKMPGRRDQADPVARGRAPRPARHPCAPMPAMPPALCWCDYDARANFAATRPFRAGDPPHLPRCARRPAGGGSGAPLRHRRTRAILIRLITWPIIAFETLLVR